MHVPITPGTYGLVLSLAEPATITVGRLGPLRFEAGFYLYAGSALGGLAQRIARHLRREKRLHWHIDYLLTQAVIVEIWYTAGAARRECLWAQALRALPGASAYPAPLGASDCACQTHLFFSSHRPDSELFRALLPAEDQVLIWPQTPKPPLR